jgi:hypothetical protein
MAARPLPRLEQRGGLVRLREIPLEAAQRHISGLGQFAAVMLIGFLMPRRTVP